MTVEKARDRKPGPCGAGGGGRAAPRHPLPSQQVFGRDPHSQVGLGHNSPSGSVQQRPGALPRPEHCLAQRAACLACSGC